MRLVTNEHANPSNFCDIVEPLKSETNKEIRKMVYCTKVQWVERMFDPIRSIPLICEPLYFLQIRQQYSSLDLVEVMYNSLRIYETKT